MLTKKLVFWHAYCPYLDETTLLLIIKGERIMKKFSVFAVAFLTLVSVSGVFANSSNSTSNSGLNDSIAVDTTIVQSDEDKTSEPAPAEPAQEVAPADTVK